MLQSFAANALPKQQFPILGIKLGRKERGNYATFLEDIYLRGHSGAVFELGADGTCSTIRGADETAPDSDGAYATPGPGRARVLGGNGACATVEARGHR